MSKKLIILLLLADLIITPFALHNINATNEQLVDTLSAIVPEGFEKIADWEVIPFRYTAPDREDIVFYQCRTTFYQENIPAMYYEKRIFAKIVDTENVDEALTCFVNEQPATLYRKGELSYLCWVISPQYCAVLQYAPDSVSDTDIKRMAESVEYVKRKVREKP